MTQYKMLSDEFIGKRRRFMAANSKTMFSNDHRGAHDAVTNQLRSALKQTGVTAKQLGTALRNVRHAYDQMTDAPDPEVVAAILEALKEGGIPDAGIVKIMKSLDDKWPGCAGQLAEPGEHADDDFVDEKDMTDDDFPSQSDLAEADVPPGNNPNRNYSAKGGNNFGTDDPPDFPGKPIPGGSSVPIKKKEMSMDSAMNDYYKMFPDAARIGLDNQIPMSPRSYAATPQYVRPAHRKANSRGIAMDAAERTAANRVEDDYEKMFGSPYQKVV